MTLSRSARSAIAALFIFGASAYAQNPISTPYVPTFQGLSGTGPYVTDTWTNLSSTNHPGYPGISGSQLWPAPIGSDIASNRLAVFQKTPGSENDDTDFLDAGSGGGIYSFFSNTHFEISSASPLANADLLQLQISMAEGATGADLIAGPTLTLSTTNGTFTLAPTTSALLGQTPVTIPAFGNIATTINLESYGWDVSTYAGTINGVTIDWQVDMHSITYGAQLAQAVPEPSSFALAIVCGVTLLIVRRRKLIPALR